MVDFVHTIIYILLICFFFNKFERNFPKICPKVSEFISSVLATLKPYRILNSQFTATLQQFNSLNCLNNIRCKRQNIKLIENYTLAQFAWLLHRSYPWNILLFHFYCFMPSFMQTLWHFRYYHSILHFIRENKK